MIGRLTGEVVDKEADGAVINVNGVGYHTSLPLNVLVTLPPVGEQVTLHIHTYVKEDELRLFGFDTKQSRTAFRALLKISGVGPKVALAVIGAINGPQLLETVQNGDTRRLSAIPGIGKKTAERMILELGGKLRFDPPGGEGSAIHGVFADLSSALKNLGFKGPLVQTVLTEMEKDVGDDTDFASLLKLALKTLQTH